MASIQHRRVLLLKLSKSFYNENGLLFHAHKSWLLTSLYWICGVLSYLAYLEKMGAWAGIFFFQIQSYTLKTCNHGLYIFHLANDQFVQSSCNAPEPKIIFQDVGVRFFSP